MPPPTSWSDLAGARVGVWGLGVEGRANLARLDQLGTRVHLVDDRPPDGGLDGRPVLATAHGGLDALAGCDVVVKSPGISRYRPDVARLVAAGVPVAGGLGLWLADGPVDRVACITGTKGKSTTTSIAGHLARGLGQRVMVGGNLGTPPWDPAAGTDFDYWLIETSSFQATDVTTSPPVVAVTSLHPDHLDWHGDAEHYFADKLSLCSRPGARTTVANGDSPELRRRADQLGPAVEWVTSSARPVPPWVGRLGVLGEHNVANARMARAVLVALGVAGADDEGALARAADGFAGLQSRLQLVASHGGVDYVDDSLATNVLPTLAALQAFGDRAVALLVGGHDRGIDYGPLAAGLAARRRPTLVVTMPDNGGRIADALAGRCGPDVVLVGPHELADAVVRATAWSRPGGVVLLSPAAPSFGRFADYKERSAAFGACVARLGPSTTDPGA